MDSESDTSVASPPNVSVGSAGSSVSSRLQEEYESLLKFALVTPASVLNRAVEEDQLHSDDQIRLLRTSNPNPHPLPATIHRIQSPLLSQMSSEDSEPTKLSRPGSRERPLSTVPPTVENSLTTTTGLSIDTTEGEREKEKSVQNRVFGTMPVLQNSGQTSACTLDDLDASVEEESASLGQKFANVTEQETLAVTHDSDIVRLESQLDEWNLALRQNILAELTQIKLKLLQQQKCRVLDEREKNNERLARLTMQNDELKELVASCERNIAQKDLLIANLTTSLNKQKTKEGLVKSFNVWKLRHSDEKREDFCGRIALEYYTRRLVSRAFRSWQSVQENKWKERVERACQNRAQEVCEQLTRDYEDKVSLLQRQLGAAHSEIAGLRADRDQFEERMKKGFMRGVCALNLEAMTMFKEGEEGAKENLEPSLGPIIQPLQSVPVQSDHPLSNITTTSYPPSKPVKQVLVQLKGASSGKPVKPAVENVVVERHSGPTHHPPLRVPPKKHRPKSQMAVKIVE